MTAKTLSCYLGVGGHTQEYVYVYDFHQNNIRKKCRARIRTQQTRGVGPILG